MKLRFFLEYQSQKLAIEEPVGWDAAKFNLVRNKTWHSVSFEYIPEKLRFYKDSGLRLLKQAFKAEGIDAFVRIYVDIFDSGQYQYQPLYVGRVALHEYEELRDGKKQYLSLSIEQEDFGITFKNKEDLKVALSGNEINLLLHSKLIKLADRIASVEGASSYETSFTIVGNNTIRIPHYLFETNKEIGDTVTLQFPLERLGSFQASPEQPLFALRQITTYKLRYRLKGTFVEFCNRPRTYNLNMVYRRGKRTPNQLPVINEPFKIFPNRNMAGGQTMTQPFDEQGELTFSNADIDEFVWFSFQLINYNVPSNTNDPQPTSLNITYDPESFIEIEQESIFPASTAKAYLVHEAFRQVVEQNTGVPNSFYSEYFGRVELGYGSNGAGAALAITNGLQIRQFPLAEKPVFCSFKELYEAMNALHNLGVGIEEKDGRKVVRIEPKEYFYSDEVALGMEGVKELRYSIASEYYYNEVEVGYRKYEIEEVNGIDEFATKHQYSLPVEMLKGKLEIMSPYVASGYAIEFTRRKKEQKTTDWKYDNDNFVICLNPNNLSLAERNERFPVVQEVFSPETSYNLRISPKRNLLRWRNLLGTSLWKKPLSENVRFTYGETNYAMASAMQAGDPDAAAFGGQLLAENQNLALDSEEERLFVPMLAEFSFPLDRHQLFQLRANANKCIAFRQNSKEPWQKGYIDDISYTALTGLTQFKLLLKKL